MPPITHSAVESLVRDLPEEKLPDAYRMLSGLTNGSGASTQLDFMQLSLSERRRLMARQAQEIAGYYEQTADERESWQSGDFQDE